MVAGEGRGMTAFGWRGPDAGVRWAWTLRLAGGRGGGGGKRISDAMNGIATFSNRR